MSNLLRKASIITTPTAYAEDYLYSIKPAYALGSELVTQFDGVADGTDVATLAGWSAYNTATSRNVVDEKLVIVTSGGNQGAKFTATTTVGTKYLFKATATGDLGSSGIYINSGTLNLNLDTSSGNIEVTFTAALAATNLFFRASNNNAGTTTYSNISLKEVTDADFDFDRNSTGTRVNEDYLIEDVPYNLLQQSEDATTTWIKTRSSITANSILAPNGTLTGNKFIGATASGDKKLSQSITVNSGEQYTLSVFAKKGEFNGILLRHNTTRFPSGHVIFNLDTGVGVQTDTVDSFSSENVGNGWYRLSVTSTADLTGSNTEELIIANNGDTAITGNDSDGIYIWGMQSVKGDQPKDYLKTTDRLDIPRIDYTNGEPSILLEPSRTNNVINSNSSFIAGNTTITYNNINSPEGIQNAFKVECTSTGTGVFARTNSISFTDATFSLFVKYGNTQYLQFLTSNQSAHFFNFDVKNGVFGTNGSNTSNLKAVEYPNGWYRVSGYFTSGSGTGNFRVYLSNSNSAAYGAASATSGDFLYSYGWQVENGSYATSLIHTSGSAVTRSADAANNAGNSDLFNDSEGVLYAEILIEEEIDSNVNISVSKGVHAEDAAKIIYLPSENQFRFQVFGGTVQTTINYNNLPLGVYNKIACSYNESDIKLYINGVEISTESTNELPSGLNKLSFDRADGSAPFFGNAKMVAVFKEALSDEELACLTSPNNNEIFLNYYNRMQYVNATTEAMGCAQKTYTI